MWLILGLIGHIGNAFVAIADKASIEKRIFDPRALAFISGASNIFFFLLFPWYLKTASGDVTAAAFFSGVCFVAGVYFYFFSLDRDETSRVVPAIGSLIPIATFVFSFFLLHERLGGNTLVAFIFLIAGGLLIELKSLANFFSRRILALFSAEALAALLLALSSVFLKYAFEETDDFSAFLWSRIGFVGAAFPLLFFTSVRKEFSMSNLKIHTGKKNWWFAGSRILAGVIPLLVTAAIALGSPTLVNALQGAQYGFLFLLAMIFSKRWPKIFGEDTGYRSIIQKSVATVLIISGLYFLV